MSAVTTTPPKPTLAEYISKDPAILAGKPYITGTRVRVQDIYELHECLGWSIDALQESWPYLTRAQIYAALTYAWENRDEILALLQRADEAYAALKKQGPSLTEKALARLHGQTA